jgi:hypothetical protein
MKKLPLISTISASAALASRAVTNAAPVALAALLATALGKLFNGQTP